MRLSSAFAFAALTLALNPIGGSAEGVTLTVQVAGVRSAKGSVFCELFAAPDGFPTDPKRAAQKTRVDISGGEARCVFHSLTPGTFAVAAFHDENGNGKLDTNFLGIPSEGVAVSNDAKGHFGPPHFADAKFAVGAAGGEIRIHLAY